MRFYLFLAFLVALSGCGHSSLSVKPPATFTEADIIGTWESASKINQSQTLSIRTDHTFTQHYTIDSRKTLTEIDGTWHVEYRASGCVYVHFEKMRFNYQTEDIITSGNHDADGTLIEFRGFCEGTHITMPDKVTLSIGSNPEFPRGIALRVP